MIRRDGVGHLWPTPPGGSKLISEWLSQTMLKLCFQRWRDKRGVWCLVVAGSSALPVPRALEVLT